MDLIRKILLTIEAEEDAGGLAKDGYSEQEIGYHCWLILDAGLAEGSDVTCRDGLGSQAILYGLNWNGHEFLDAARDPGRWAKTMEKVKELGGAITFAGIKAILSTLMEQAAKASLGG
ncbi:MAG: DUF2513 domain-containing protein [Pirellulaceae bacterium]